MANGDHDFTAGEILTAANVDDYLMLQAVQKFATAAARDSALTARKREGMLTYQDDINTLTNYTGSAWSTIGPANGGGITWAPTITQNVTVTYTNTSGTYSRLGRRVFCNGKFSITGAGTASNLITITLPVTALSANDGGNIGTGYFTDASTGNYLNGFATQANAGVSCYMNIGAGAVGAETASRVGTGFPTVALASGDVISLCLMYEAAADG